MYTAKCLLTHVYVANYLLTVTCAFPLLPHPDLRKNSVSILATIMSNTVGVTMPV